MLLKPHWLGWAYTEDSEIKRQRHRKLTWEILAGQTRGRLAVPGQLSLSISGRPLRAQRSHRLNLYISKLAPTRSQPSTFLDHTQYTAAHACQHHTSSSRPAPLHVPLSAEKLSSPGPSNSCLSTFSQQGSLFPKSLSISGHQLPCPQPGPSFPLSRNKSYLQSLCLFPASDGNL